MECLVVWSRDGRRGLTAPLPGALIGGKVPTLKEENMSWTGRRLTPLAVLVATTMWLACGDVQEDPVAAPDGDLTVPPVAMQLNLPSGGGSGAIFTTTPDGSIVNENVRYDFKREVYLDGGPPNNAPAKAAGLDAGFYVFQITDPPGKLLLSRDPARCRIVEVSEDGVIVRRVPANDPGVVGYTGADGDNWVNDDVNGQLKGFIGEPCAVPDDDEGEAGDNATTPDIDGLGRHDTNMDVDHGDDVGAIVVQMMPYGTTPNPGGVYKAWMTPIDAYVEVKGADLNEVPSQKTGRIRPHPCYDFCADADPGFVPSNRYTKTDNFKVDEQFAGEIKVRKFHDVDGDGYWDEGEPEIGVDEFVDDETGELYDEKTENSGGWPFAYTEPGFLARIEFTPFHDYIEAPGVYTAEEDYLTGWKQSASWLDGSYDAPFQKTVSVTVVASGETHEIWFGNYQPGKITGKKVIDYDADGVIDAGDICDSGDAVNHPGCYDVKVTLTGTTNMGATVNTSAQTAADGSFSFGNLDPGVYTVEIKAADEPAGFTCSYPSGCKYTGIVINSGDHVDLNKKLTGDAAFADWQPGSKSGLKFDDRDADGAYEPGAFDGPLEGWKIALFNADGSLKATTMTADGSGTDPKGYYEFTGLKPGTYTVCEVLKDGTYDKAADGWFQTYPETGSEVVDCPPTGAPSGPTYGAKGYQFTVTSGSVHQNNDFGNALPFAIKICKKKDADGDFYTDTDRYDLSGWKVEVTKVTASGSTVVRSGETGEDGCIEFDDLPPLADGYYTVAEETREGWITLAAYFFDPNAVGGPVVEMGAAELSFDGFQFLGGDSYGIEFINTPTQGCTPGFWQGGPDKPDPQSGGARLWDQNTDPDWVSSGGDDYNPFVHTTDFEAFFGDNNGVVPDDGFTMFELIDTGGTSDNWRKAARSLVAAYLNASWGVAYAYSTAELQDMWDAADTDAKLLALHTMLDKANNAPGGCPISAGGY
jgi:hypothetical protein